MDVLTLRKDLFLEDFVCTTDSHSSLLYGSHQQKENKRHVKVVEFVRPSVSLAVLSGAPPEELKDILMRELCRYGSESRATTLMS